MKLSPVLRSFDMLMVALLIGVVIWTFKVKNDSGVALERVAELEKKIAAEEIEIDLLLSDWGLLTNPARLEKLVERYGEQLDLEPTMPSQLASPSDLPPIKEDFDPVNTEVNPDFANTDATLTTGRVKRSSESGEQ